MSTELRAHLHALVTDARRLSQSPSAPGGETILRDLSGKLPVVTLVANNEGRFVAANAAASIVTGYSNRELLALWVWDLTPADLGDTADILWRAFLQQREQHGDYLLLTKDRRSIPTVYAARAHVLPGLHVSLMGIPRAD